jgi:CHAT domain-containing protein
MLECSQLSLSAGQRLIRAHAAKMAGSLNAAARHFEQFVQAQSGVLERTAELNKAPYAPTDVKPIAGTLINGLFMYADVLESLQRRRKAEEKRLVASELSKRYLGAAGSAEAERARVAALISQARFNEALVALYTAREFFQKEGNLLKVARTSLDLADLLQWLGDYTRALDELDHSLAICSGAKERRGWDAIVDFVEKRRIETELKYNRGLVAKYSGKFEEAERWLREVLPTYQSLGVGAAIEYQIASVLIRHRKPKEGLALATKLEPDFRRDGRLRPKLAAILNIQAEGLIKLGQPEQAMAKLEEGLRDLDNYYDLDLRWRLEWQYASALRNANRRELAIEAYGDAIDTVVQLRKAPLGYRLDSTYLKDKIDLFQEAISLAAESGMAEECALYIDLIKSRTLSATLSIPRRDNFTATSRTSDKFEEITQRLDASEYSGFREGWTAELRRERERLLEERAAILEQLRFSDPRWRNLSEPVALNMNKLVEELRSRNQAALSIFLQGKQLTAVLLTGDTQLARTLTLSDHVQSKLRKYVGNLQKDQPNVLLFDPSSRLSITAEAIIPSELLSRAVVSESLVVIPHGQLHLLPWAALTYKDKRLFQYCPVGVLPNLSSLVSLSEKPSLEPKIAIAGPPDYSRTKGLNPLRSAKREVDELKKMYAKQGGIVGRPLVGRAATEANFWKLARDPNGKSGILHISCHGGSETDEPMNSGLYLYDGKADAAEAARTPLPYHEVVLSACSTGWRPIRVAGVELVGDDILGLPGAFLEAGARCVLVSIPKVPDEVATDFMIRYHRSRSAGSSPLHAFREAQLDMLADTGREPALWSGFTLYGCR